MNIKPILLLCIVAALPSVAVADISETPPSSLGMVHAILNYCARIDPHNNAVFRAEWINIVGSETSLAHSVEQDATYRQAYDWMTKLLSGTPKDRLARTCAIGAANLLEGHPDGHRDEAADRDSHRDRKDSDKH